MHTGRNAKEPGSLLWQSERTTCASCYLDGNLEGHVPDRGEGRVEFSLREVLFCHQVSNGLQEETDDKLHRAT